MIYSKIYKVLEYTHNTVLVVFFKAPIFRDNPLKSSPRKRPLAEWFFLLVFHGFVRFVPGRRFSDHNSLLGDSIYGCFQKNRDTPKWMVYNYIMEKPIKIIKIGWFGGTIIYFRKHPNCHCHLCSPVEDQQESINESWIRWYFFQDLLYMTSIKITFTPWKN